MASEIKVNTIKDLGGNTIVSSNGSGTISGLPASAISSGTVATARLGSGTASSSTFLAGDSSYKTVSGTTINNNADNRVITGSGTANTLEGEANLTFDGSTLACQGSAIFNESGADVDFRVEGDTDVNMIYGDASSNNVGIGTATPQAKAHIYRGASGQSTPSANADELVVENSDHGGISILTPYNKTGAIYFGDGSDDNIGMIEYPHDANCLKFTTNASEAMRIDNNGYLLMDKTSSNTGVVGTELHGSQIIVTRSDQYASYIGRKNADGTMCQFLRDGNEVGSISVNSSATGYNTSSDYRLKENVDYDFDATTRLKQLKPARFNFIIDETNTLVDGFLAHEVSSIIPEAISGTKDETETKQKVILNADGTLLTDNIEEANWIAGKSNEVLYTADDELPEGKNIGDIKTEATYKSDTTWEATKVVPKYQAIDQSKLVPLLVKTIQELEARITTLENA